MESLNRSNQNVASFKKQFKTPATVIRMFIPLYNFVNKKYMKKLVIILVSINSSLCIKINSISRDISIIIFLSKPNNLITISLTLKMICYSTFNVDSQSLLFKNVL